MGESTQEITTVPPDLDKTRIAGVASEIVKQDHKITAILNASRNVNSDAAKRLGITPENIDKLPQIARKGTLEELQAGKLSTGIEIGVPTVITGEAVQLDIYNLEKSDLGQGTAWVLHFAPGGASSKEQLEQKGMNTLEALVIGRRDLKNIMECVDDGVLDKPTYIFGGTTNTTMNDFLERSQVAEMVDLDTMPFSDNRIANINYSGLANLVKPRRK